MHVKWIYQGSVSSVADSSGIPVGVMKDKKLSSPRKCSYKVNINFTNRDVRIYYCCLDVTIEIRFFSFVYNKCGDISIIVMDINHSISESVDIIFIHFFMLNVSQ